MKQSKSPFNSAALSGFCMQLYLLFQSGVSFSEGLSVMAEDARDEAEKSILTAMAENLELGASLTETIKKTGIFPSYMEEMIRLGEQTGTLDRTLQSLSEYYDREARLAESLRRALTYPAMMVVMLLVILFVLFVRVMPVFSGVYEQLGAQIPPVAQAAIQIGGIASGVALVVIALFAVAVFSFRLLGKSGKQPAFAASVIQSIKARSSISRLTALRRFCNTMAISMQCGLLTEDGLTMSESLVEHPELSASIKKTKESILEGNTFYESVKNAGIFTGFDLQLLRVAGRAGQTDQILEKLSDDYDQKATDALDSMVAKMEPIIVTILAVAVGLVLLSVMLPLAGILSTIG